MEEFGRPRQHYFSPYADNGGTVLGIAGDDFVVVASDTRLSDGYAIHSRHVPKVYPLTNNIVLGCAGFHGDVLTVTKIVERKVQNYEHEFGRPISCPAVAQMLSSMLYYRRFFPYYTHNMIGGLDDEGKGAIFSYDSIGSFERESYRATGSASSLLQPLLDSKIGLKNQVGVTPTPLTIEEAVAIVKDVFISATEREIETGDGLVIHVVTAKDTIVEEFPLRRD